jgi:hypothetical protein
VRKNKPSKLGCWVIVIVCFLGIVGLLSITGILGMILWPSQPVSQTYSVFGSSTAIPTKPVSVLPAAKPSSTDTNIRTGDKCDALLVCKQVEIMATTGWQSYEIAIEKGQNVRITYVSGLWSPWPGADSLPYGTGTGGYFFNEAGYATLIGRLGSLPPFVIGRSYQFKSDVSAVLYLRMNDVDVGDNSGSIIMLIEVW